MADKPKARSKQTDATLEAICEALRMGVPSSRASKAAGISYQTFCTWRTAGWEAIEAADEDSDAPLTFVARFAVEVEAALVAFMGPFLKRIREEATGKGKGDWRACRAILEMRFPDEFSEKVRAAQTAKLEISGTVTHEMRQIYDDHLRWKNMDRLELKYELERLDAQIVEHAVEGENLDAEITFLEGKLAAMCQSRARGTPFYPGNWLTGNPAIKPAAPAAIELDESEYTELAAVSGAAPVSLAPDSTDAAVVLPESAASVAPSPEIAPARVQTGIAYDAHGLAFHPTADEVDEDVTL